jgi:26S proteasome regulatory subunit N6
MASMMDVASNETKGEVEKVDMELEEEEVLDELKIAFEELEGNSCKDVSEYEKLMDNDRVDELAVKMKEKVISKMTRLYTEGKNTAAIMGLMKKNSDFFGAIPKAKTAKIVRNILSIVSTIPDSQELQVSLCDNLISWCEEEKRTFLRQRIDARLCVLLLNQKDTTRALKIVNKLLSELKKLDDKQMLTEVHLTESRIYHVLENIPKSKASLTASRSAANSIYVVPLLQAELDEMSGVLCCEEGDNSTAFSYVG